MKNPYSVFSLNQNDQMKEPIFLGQPVNVARYDQQKYRVFEDLIEMQLSFFWRPEEIDVTTDRADYNSMPENEQHIFISNLKYQTLLDSIQGRSPNVALLPIVSIPEFETWIETWAFSETIHSRSYTHIIRGIVNDPSLIFDDIVINEHIRKRAEQISYYYDRVIHFNNLREMSATYPDLELPEPYDEFEHKKAIYLALHCTNALEGIRFYVSFACSFAFAERKLMEGNSKIIKLIARDELLHLQGTQETIKLIDSGAEGSDWKMVSIMCQDEARKIFEAAEEQEIEWADYLFKDGGMIGLNKNILTNYIRYVAAERKAAINITDTSKTVSKNPIPWIDGYLSSDQVQVAPQEAELSSYLTNQVNTQVTKDAFSDITL